MAPTISLKKFVFLALALFAFESTYCSTKVRKSKRRENHNNYIGGNNNYISNSNGNIHISNEDMTLESNKKNKTIKIAISSDGWTIFVNKENITENNEDNSQTVKIEASRMKPFLFGLVCGSVATFGLVIAIGKAVLKKQQANPATRRSL